MWGAAGSAQSAGKAGQNKRGGWSDSEFLAMDVIFWIISVVRGVGAQVWSDSLKLPLGFDCSSLHVSIDVTWLQLIVCKYRCDLTTVHSMKI